MGYGLDEGLEFDPIEEIEELLSEGKWKQKDGTVINITSMSKRHLHNCINLMEKFQYSCNCTYDIDRVKDIINDLETYESKLTKLDVTYNSPSKIKPTRGKKVNFICFCGTEYSPRVADVKRGYGKSCCKSCSSVKREYGRPDPVCKDTGRSYNEVRKDLSK